ncbi:CRIB domain-containing protein RIC1-like [Impatiens glandulifera]|uniref:CRIB domain-containing protein RIC1-like n=1 Tax=Impatiens glandulifera TaxID=253017 RepID=UPI001FB15E8C|nr:CRIB domain-containing protein RIC1-like [Impatiens glandulifera]
MTTQSVKGLLKGLRYISQIFDEKEGEATIEIGFPTDVKHVAHIGSDGPSNSQPTWMNEFSETSKSTPTPAPEAPSQGNEQQNNDDALDSRRKSNKKQTRRRSSSDGGLILESASKEPNSNPTTTITKPRRIKNSGGESPAHESTTTRSAKVPTHKKKSDKLPRPKAREKRSSGNGSSDITNEMSLDLVAEEDDNEYGDRAKRVSKG